MSEKWMKISVSFHLFQMSESHDETSEIPVANSEFSLQDTPRPAVKRTVPLTDARLESLKRAREQKAIKKKEQPSREQTSTLFKSVEQEEKLFALWQKKQQLKKDATWTTLLNRRLDAFEGRVADMLTERMNKLKRDEASEEEPEVPIKRQQQQVASSSEKNPYSKFF
jgi:hypothetical protein